MRSDSGTTAPPHPASSRASRTVTTRDPNVQTAKLVKPANRISAEVRLGACATALPRVPPQHHHGCGREYPCHDQASRNVAWETGEPPHTREDHEKREDEVRNYRTGHPRRRSAAAPP